MLTICFIMFHQPPDAAQIVGSAASHETWTTSWNSWPIGGNKRHLKAVDLCSMWMSSGFFAVMRTHCRAMSMSCGSTKIHGGIIHGAMTWTAALATRRVVKARCHVYDRRHAGPQHIDKNNCCLVWAGLICKLLISTNLSNLKWDLVLVFRRSW